MAQRFGTYTANRIPVESSGVSFSLPGEKRRPINIPASGEVTFGAVRKAGQQVLDIGVRMRDARMAQELADAQVENRVLFADLDAQMQDPEFKKQYGPDEYEAWLGDKADTAWETYSQSIKETRVKREARRDFDVLKTSYTTRARARARDVEISTGRASTEGQLRNLQEVLLRGDAQGDTRAAADALVTAQSIVAGKVQAGFFSPEEGDTILEAFRKDSVGTMWSRRIQEDPAATWMELLKAKEIPNLRQSEQVFYTKMAQTAYESMLRTQWYMASRQEAAAGKDLRARQSRVAGDFWTRVQNQDQIRQGELDKALAVQDLELTEYKALSKAVKDPDAVQTDDGVLVREIEQMLDRGELEQARLASYNGLIENRLKMSTGVSYISGIRSAEASATNKDYTAANGLLRAVFRQDGIFPDYTMVDRYANATLEVQAAQRLGKNPMSVAIDIFEREKGTVEMNAIDWPGGAVTVDSIEAYKADLVRRLQAGEINDKTYMPRYDMANQALQELKRNEELSVRIEEMRRVLK